MYIQKNKFLYFIFTLALIYPSIQQNCLAAEKSKIGFYEVPPYISSQLDNYGAIGILLTKALANKNGIQFIAVTPIRVGYLLDQEEIDAGITTSDDLCNQTDKYKCSTTIKTAHIVLAYQPENVELANINTLNDLKKYATSIGKPTAYTFRDNEHNRFAFKETKDTANGFELLKLHRLKGLLVAEENFDYNQKNGTLSHSISKSKPLIQVPIRIIVKNNDKYTWIIQNINDYVEKGK